MSAGARGSNAPLLVALATAALAAFLAAVRPVWLDELYTLRLARLPVREIFRALETDSGPPGFYLIARGIFLLARWPEGSDLGIFLVRLPSILGAALAAALVTRAGRRSGRWPIAPLLLLLWLPFWYFASEARPYALLAATVALVFLRGPEWLEREGSSTWSFGLAVGALPLLHNTGVLYAAAAFPLILRVPGAPRRARAAAVTLLSLAPFAAFLPTLLRQPRESIAWMTRSRPGLSTLGVLAPAGPFPRLVEPPEPIVSPLLSAAVLLLLVVAAGVGAVRHLRARESSGALLPVALGLLPIAAILASPLLGTSLYFPARSEAAAMPLLACLAAAGLAATRLGPVTLVPFAALALPTLAAWIHALPSRPDPPGVRAAEVLSHHLDGKDLVVSAGLFELELRWGFARAALRRRVEPPEVVPYPLALARHPGWIGPAALTPSSLAADRLRIARLLELLRPPRVVLVGSPPLVDPLRILFGDTPATKLFDDPAFVVEVRRFGPR